MPRGVSEIHRLGLHVQHDRQRHCRNLPEFPVDVVQFQKVQRVKTRVGYVARFCGRMGFVCDGNGVVRFSTVAGVDRCSQFVAFNDYCTNSALV